MTFVRWLSPLVVAATAACGGEQGEHVGAEPGSDAGASTITLRQCMGDWFTQSPLEGWVGWVEGQPEVAQAISGSDGCYTLEGIPANAEIVNAGRKDGYISVRYPMTTTDVDIDLKQIIVESSPQIIDAFQMFFGEPVDFNRGLVFAAVLDARKPFELGLQVPVGEQVVDQTPLPGLAGVTFALDPPAPIAYFQDRVPDPSRTETGEAGAAMFINVPVGEVELSVDPALDCSFEPPGYFLGWRHPTEPNTLRLPIERGVSTTVFLICSP